MVANIDGTRDISHVGLCSNVFRSLIVRIQVVRLVHGVPHEIEYAFHKFACCVTPREGYIFTCRCRGDDNFLRTSTPVNRSTV